MTLEDAAALEGNEPVALALAEAVPVTLGDASMLPLGEVDALASDGVGVTGG